MNRDWLRLTGSISRTARGLALQTDAGEFWVLETSLDVHELPIGRVIAEGVRSGFDRLKVEWIGAVPNVAKG